MQNVLYKTEFTSSFLAPERIKSNLEFIAGYGNNLLQNQEVTPWQALLHIQSPEVVYSETGATPKAIWNLQERMYEQSLLEIIDQPAFQQDWTFSADEITYYQTELAAALSFFEMHFPETYEQFKAFIKVLLFAKRDAYDGGSVSSRMGMIWLSPKRHWTTVQWTDNLVHEFVHNCLFLEDMVHGIFPLGAARMAEDDALVMSSIRKQKRGYDKSYHAAFVAFTLVEFYYAIGNTAKAENLLLPLLVSLDELSANRNFITRNGAEHLDILINNVIKKAGQFNFI